MNIQLTSHSKQDLRWNFNLEVNIMVASMWAATLWNSLSGQTDHRMGWRTSGNLKTTTIITIKTKNSPILVTERRASSVGPEDDPGVQSVSLQVSKKSTSGRLPLLSARPACRLLHSRRVSPPIGRYQIILLDDTSHACEQLAQESSPATIQIRNVLDREQTLYRYTTQATIASPITS